MVETKRPPETSDFIASSVTPETVKSQLKSGEQTEIFLGFERWTKDGVPNPNSQLEETKKSFIIGLEGVLDHEIWTYSDPESNQNFYQQSIKTGSGLYLVQTYYPEQNLCTFSARADKPKHLPEKPKMIDIAANVMKGISNNEHKETRFEGRSQDFIETVKTVKYLSIDADDCILPTTDSDPHNIEKLKEFARLTRDLNQVGITTVINTGRGIADVKKTISLIEQLGGNIPYAICENGSVRYYRTTDTYEVDLHISQEALVVKDTIFNYLNQLISPKFSESGEPISPKFGSFESGKALGISINPTPEGISKAKLEIPESQQTKDINIFREWIQKQISAGIEIISQQAIKAAEAKGMHLTPQDAKFMVSSTVNQIKNSSTAVDINPSKLKDGKIVGIDKKDGIHVFAEEMGIKPQNGTPVLPEIIGIGDSGGDLPALEEVATAIPWNATPDLKDNPKKIKVIYCSPLSMTEGVNDILEAIYKTKLELIKEEETKN